jgi:hypothetical protein
MNSYDRYELATPTLGTILNNITIVAESAHVCEDAPHLLVAMY